MIKIGSNDINIYIGSTQVSSVYLGTQEVWSNGWGGLSFTAKSATASVSLANYGGNAPDIEYSTDSSTWSAWDYSAISLNSGDTIYFRGDNLSGFSQSTSIYSQFVISGQTDCKGNIMSLIDSLNFSSCRAIPNNHCFFSLFAGCSGLLTTPRLTATALTQSCYDTMFSGCTSITKTSALPAQTLAINCYARMFGGCTSLTQAPALPATACTNGCYGFMFDSCSSLVTPPTLPSTTVAVNCYTRMFAFCTALTTAPELPATALTTDCYTRMFDGCTSLVVSPALPAKTLTDRCYTRMFRNCSSLSKITCLATDIDATDCTLKWTENVASGGTFIKDGQMSGWTTGDSGIPSGWTVGGGDEYLTFTCIQAGTIGLVNENGNQPYLQYSLDFGNTWTDWSYSYTPISLSAGQTVKFRGYNDRFSRGISTRSYFTVTGEFSLGGNLMTLLDFSGSTRTVTARGFTNLFHNCSGITNIDDLKLPATQLGDDCYNAMFWGCGFSSVPADLLQAENIGMGSYGSMFQNRVNLVEAPVISASTIQDYSMNNMFNGCTSLLSSVTVIDATYIPSSALIEMFKNASSLCYVRFITNGNVSGSDWMSGVAADGTFVKKAGIDVTGIPSGWTVVEE